MEKKDRKRTRLKEYNYSENGAYFITICTKDMQCFLSKIVGDGAPDVPKLCLTDYGDSVKNEILKMNSIYFNVQVNHFVIMPNHIHFMIEITDNDSGTSRAPDGTSRAPSSTNSVVAKYVSTLKRMTNKRCDTDLWQRSYYDHIIRNEEDYLLHIRYIEENPKKWLMGKDEYYS